MARRYKGRPMKITDVQAILMSDPLPQPMVMPFFNGQRTILKRDAMLIRVLTDTDLVGYASGPAHERASTVIHQIIRPFLLGKDPSNWDKLNFPSQNTLDLQKTYHAVEIAL